MKRLIFILCIAFAAWTKAQLQGPGVITDCLIGYNNIECQTGYDVHFNSCYDFLMAGHQKSGLYPFGKKNQIWCEFNDDLTNATTIVHNALESHRLHGKPTFDLVSTEKERAFNVEYEMDHYFIRSLSNASAACWQEMLLNDCPDYENMKDAIDQKAAVMLSADCKNMTKKDFEGNKHCKTGETQLLNLTTAVLSLGLKATDKSKYPRIKMSLGPLHCVGRKKEKTNCTVKFESSNALNFTLPLSAEEISFHFRTLLYDTPLVSIHLSNNQSLDISLNRGWLLTLTGIINNETLLHALKSDGHWHKLRVHLRDSKLIINIDSIIFTWKLKETTKMRIASFGLGFLGCIKDLKINGSNRCEELQKLSMPPGIKLSDCDHRICNPRGEMPCTKRPDCVCRCADLSHLDKSDHCDKNNLVDNSDKDHTATFFSPILNEANNNFIWARPGQNYQSFSISFYFKTDQSTALLAYFIQRNTSDELIAQIWVQDGYFIHANYCIVKESTLNCIQCFIKSETGFNDYLWHYVSLDYSRGRTFLFASSGSCQFGHWEEILTVDAGMHVPRIYANLRYLAYFGGVPDDSFVKDNQTDMVGYNGFKSKKGPNPLMGCLSLIRFRSDGHFGPSRLSHALSLPDQISRSQKLLNDGARSRYHVKTGCDHPFDCSSTCGKGIPCVFASGTSFCNCSSKFLVQKDSTNRRSCRDPENIIKKTGYNQEKCAVIPNATLSLPKEPEDLLLEFSSLWFSFQLLPEPEQGKELFSFTSRRKEDAIQFSANLQSRNKIEIIRTGSNEKLEFVSAIPLSDSPRQHIFVLQKLAKNSLKLQINHKSHLISMKKLHYLDADIEPKFNRFICISNFVVQYKTRSGVAQIFEYDDLIKSPSGQISQSVAAAVKDFSVLNYDMPLLSIKSTSYPPDGSQCKRPDDATVEHSSGSLLWIIGVVLGVILIIIIIVALIVYFFGRKRHSRSHKIPTEEPEDKYRGKDFDSQENIGARPKPTAVSGKPREEANLISPMSKAKSNVATQSSVPISKTANEKRVIQSIFKPKFQRLPMIDDEDEGSLPSLNYSFSSNDELLTLLHDLPASSNSSLAKET